MQQTKERETAQVESRLLQPHDSVRFDLHTHTTVSDGKLSPAELVQRAANRQIDVLAITDHDTTDGVQAAHEAIVRHQYPVRLIPGVEISTRWHGFEIHVVGLGMDPAHPQLQSFLQQQGVRREIRAQRMGEKLARAGWPQVYDLAKAKAGDGQLTRTHFGQALLDVGAVSHVQQAFTRFLGKGKRAYVTPDWPAIPDAVSVIKAAGGIAVLAHPGRYDLSNKWLRRLIGEFAAYGGGAMEVALPQQRPDQRQFLFQSCFEHGLYASAGSDFHWPNRWSDLGMNLTLPTSPEVPSVLQGLAKLS